MLTITWLLQHASLVPAHDDWLSPSEREVLATLWAPKRRGDWRLGRWTAKRTLVGAGALGAPAKAGHEDWGRLSIRANEAGVPCALIDGGPCEWAISLSHSGEYGLCAVARRPAIVGCDVEAIGRRGEEFVLDYFTAPERALVATSGAEDRSATVTLIWSAKESALKALGVGLRLDTRDVEVQVAGRGVGGGFGPPAAQGAWQPFAVTAPGRRFDGWWQADAERVLTIVSDPPAETLVSLFP